MLSAIVFASFTSIAVCGLTHSSKVDRKHATDEWRPDQLHRFLDKQPVSAVLFYASWNFDSIQLMSQWDLASQKLALHDPPVPLVRANTHITTSYMAKRYNVTVLPMIKLFMNGTVEDFISESASGWASWQQIVKWVSGHLDSSHILKTADDVDHYLNDNDLNVVGLFPDGMDSSVFAEVASSFDDMIFAEARGSWLSAEVGEHLARHAALACETVNVGTSSANSKIVQLPRTGMKCSGVPRNPQQPSWSDRFQATASGRGLTIQRLDDSGGWQQLLQLKCCDAESSAGPRAIEAIRAPSIVMFMPHDEGFARYDGALDDSKALDRWIAARHYPMVMSFTEDTMSIILSDSHPKRPPLVFFSDGRRRSEAVTQAAEQLRGTVQFTLCGAQTSVERALMDLAGVSEEELPAMVLLDGSGEAGNYHVANKYRLIVKDPHVADIENFVHDFKFGLLTRWIKSEPEPEGGPNAEIPGILVGTTFEAFAHDEKVDVLVTFYAPWCGYCKKFEPQYKKLAVKLAHVASLRIMKLDATRNDVVGMKISGYPTLALFPAHTGRHHGNPKPVLYHGDREEPNLLRWLHENCAINFDETPPVSVEGSDNEELVSGLLDDDEDL